MITIRPADERGHVDHGWLKARHSFSFGRYHDPGHMGFRRLRVINDDLVAGGQGFDTHPHRDMEIITYVLEGALRHEDSLGHASVLRYGDVQRMSAGTGILHSEFNDLPDSTLRLLQIWIEPDRAGREPGYEENSFAPEDRQGRWQLIASPDGRDGSLTVGQDVVLKAARLDAGERVEHEVAAGRHVWLQVARGALKFGDQAVVEGDGVAMSAVPNVTLEGVDNAEVLLFDLS